MGDGSLWLWVALVAAVGAVAAAGVGIRWPGSRAGLAGRGALVVAAGAMGLATVQLVRALVDDDFSLGYVADFSRRHADTSYRVAALWGGMAGSLLFFATV